jgi:hypothetical protein
VPAGVPAGTLMSGGKPPLQPLANPATQITVSARNAVVAMRGVSFPVRCSISRVIPSKLITLSHNKSCGTIGILRGAAGITCAGVARAVVVSVSVVGTVPAPGVTVGGAKDAVVAAGNPVAENVTVPGKFPPRPAALIVYIADCPALIVFAPDVLLTVKSVIVNVSAFDVPPPGVGFTTVTAAVPEAAISLAEIIAVNCVEFTNVVGRALPFHCAMELAMKLVPLMVNANAAPPAAVVFGASDVSVGNGFGALIVNVNGFEVVPDGAHAGIVAARTEPKTTVGVNTVTEALPAFRISAAVIVAVSCPAFTNVVARFPPFHCTTEVFRKLPPFTVNVN